MNLLDIIVIFILLIGAYRGWKHGVFSSIVSLVGTLLVFVLAFYLKNPLSILMYENLPFLSFGGIFSGITSFNVLVYEGISYVICLIILFIILKIVLKLSGLVDKLINFTVILALPSKILGLILGVLECYIFIYVGLFVLAQLPFSAKYFNDSTFGKEMLSKTPFLSDVTNDLYASANEVYEICLKYEGIEDKTKADYESLEVLLKYDIITSDSVKKLSDKKKLNIENIDELIEKYKEDEKND